MENWHQLATKLLEKSLYPVPTELNNLDWKSGLSPKTDRLAQHICAFSNLIGGGFLVFGVNNDGSLCSVEHEFVEKTVLTLGNIAKNNLIPSTGIEHVVLEFKSHHLLFVYLKEICQLSALLRISYYASLYTILICKVNPEDR